MFDRRRFLQTAGTVAAAGLVSAETVANTPSARTERTDGSWFDPTRAWHFFDLWHFDHVDCVRLHQGTPGWREDAVFADPPIGNLSAWPTVYRHEPSGMWRMLYSADWKPLRLMIAESHDGVHWQPLPQPDIQPIGGKIAPHHIYTLPDGSGGAAYADPAATDGYRFRIFVHQQGQAVYERAIADRRHRWHELAKRNGPKRYINEEFTLVSRDGLHFESRFDLAWAKADWHPEPPIFGYFNRFTQKHMMTVRPGWGDRRLCAQSSEDFRNWSGPELMLQPDFLDTELIELYGMPVFPYGDGYVGLPWIFHCESSEPTQGFNRFVGTLDCQLAFSHDGTRFDRASRTAFISTGDPGSVIGGSIEPSCMVETDSELRIYSSASQVQHGRGSNAKRRGVEAASITLHTLRKDGLTFLRAQGATGRLISKPLVLLDSELTINASAPHGEIHFQLTDMESRPVQGFTFDDSNPLASDDSTAFAIRWANTSLAEVKGKIVRLEVRLRHARIYAVRGHFHFIDAQDRSLINDGLPVVVS